MRYVLSSLQSQATHQVVVVYPTRKKFLNSVAAHRPRERQKISYLQNSALVTDVNMVTHCKPKDVLEPWHSSKKKSASTPGRKSSPSRVPPVEGSNMDNVRGEPRRRGRPPGKFAAKGVAVPKGMKRTRPLPASAVNVLIGVSKTSVADVEELRRKRQEDAEACGRTIRTISPHPKQRNGSTIVTEDDVDEDCNSESAAPGASEPRVSPPKYSGAIASTEDNYAQEENDPVLLEVAEERCIYSQRPGKEPIGDNVLDARAPLQRIDNLQCRIGHAQRESDIDSQDRNGKQRGARRKSGRLPSKNYSKDRCKGREIDLSDSADDGLRSYQKRYDKSVSRSYKRNSSRNSLLPEWCGPQQSHSRSPVRQRRGRLNRSGHKFREDYGYPSFEDCAEEYGKSGVFYNGDRWHRRYYESSSPEKSRRHRSSNSREHGRALQRNRTAHFSTSPPRRSTNRGDVMAREGRKSADVKEEDFVETSAASDRTRRRREQAVLDAEMARRQRNGSKPFYLTLDRDRRPYGSGKPSWIAEINKLAAGLDPSCTHIKKQTFEDVQTFKDRLDDSFDYSGSLNEDYLRALMGKAVTKRRSELISLIKNNGKQPVHIDHEVWCRLQNLATSKQREGKSEQGRYANACRKTAGRTGSRGVDGVREKLRSLLGRSPDPSEVEEEMHRDKGYGGRKRKKPICSFEEKKNLAEVCLLDEDILLSRSRRNSHQSNRDANYAEPYERLPKDFAEKRGEGSRNGLLELDGVGGMTDNRQKSFTVMEKKKMSKDDYIEKLEAEIKLLQEENAKSSSSNADSPLQSTMSTRYRGAD